MRTVENVERMCRLGVVGHDIRDMLFISLFQMIACLTYVREVTGMALYLVNSIGRVGVSVVCSDIDYVMNHVVCMKCSVDVGVLGQIFNFLFDLHITLYNFYLPLYDH
jgi:hypothetical protein